MFNDDCVSDKQFIIDMLSTKNKLHIFEYMDGHITKQELRDTPNVDHVAIDDFLKEFVRISKELRYHNSTTNALHNKLDALVGKE